MNFTEFESQVAERSNGKAYNVEVRKLVHADRSHKTFTWAIWMDGVWRMATGPSPEAALADLDAILSAPAHTEQTVDPLEVPNEPAAVS